MARKTYRSEGIDVSFDPARCIHARECVRGLPAVFDVEKRPWIQPDRAAPENVAGVVMRCPTGALRFERRDGGAPEPVPPDNVVSVAEDGLLYVRGDVTLKEHDGATLARETRVALCRCGESRNKPFCDDSHESSGFRDESPPGRSPHDEETPESGGLTVTATVNGPLFLRGGFELRDPTGVALYRGNRAALCRCGHSGRKPFCDGSHGSVGWRDD